MEDIGKIRNRALKTLAHLHNKDRVALCLGYQVGDLQKAVYRISHCEVRMAVGAPGNPNPRAWLAEARLAAADASLQLRLLVNELGFSWDETIALGEEHHKEVMADVDAGRRE